MSAVKKFLSAVQAIVQGSTPGNPDSGSRLLYPKSDGWYDQDSSGNVAKIGPLGEGAIMPLVGNYLCSSIATAAAAGTTPRNTTTYLPVTVTVARSFDRIGVSVQTAAVAGTTPALRLGIYKDDGTFSGPGALVVDCGTVTITATGTQFSTTNLPVTLQPGLYWLAAQYTDGGAPTTALQLQCMGGGLSLPGSAFAETYRGLQASASAGALPTPATGVSAPSASTSALVGIRGA